MPRKPSPTTVIACLALFVALTGTAIAASGYIITSVSQIKPSVRRELGVADALASKAEPKGAKAIIARIHSTRPVPIPPAPEETEIPLAGATWTQHAQELNQMIGEATYTGRTECKNIATLVIRLDGVVLPSAQLGHRTLVSSEGETETRWLSFNGDFGATEYLYQPTQDTSHSLAVSVGGPTCGTIDSFSLDVIGVR